MQAIVEHLRMQSSMTYPMKEWLSPYRHAQVRVSTRRLFFHYSYAVLQAIYCALYQVKGDNSLTPKRASITENIFSKSLYMRASFSGQEVNNANNGDGIERALDRFRVDLTSLEASLRNQDMSSSLYKDIETIGKIIMQRKNSSAAPSHQCCDNLTLSPIPVVQNLRRDVYGNIFLTQTEMLSYIWLPHFASAEMNYDSVLALLTYIGLLKEAASVPIMPPLYVLLITVLISLGKHTFYLL